MAQVVAGEGWGARPEGAWPDEQVLDMAAAAWLARARATSDPGTNRQFLAVFAVYLVKQFRAEEECLRRINAEGLKHLLHANHRLAQQLRDLMVEVDLGLDATAGILTFLGAWRAHRQPTGPERRASGFGWH